MLCLESSMVPKKRKKNQDDPIKSPQPLNYGIETVCHDCLEDIRKPSEPSKS